MATKINKALIEKKTAKLSLQGVSFINSYKSLAPIRQSYTQIHTIVPQQTDTYQFTLFNRSKSNGQTKTQTNKNKTLANWIQLIVNSTDWMVDSMAIYYTCFFVYITLLMLLFENRYGPRGNTIKQYQINKTHAYCVIYSLCGPCLLRT